MTTVLARIGFASVLCLSACTLDTSGLETPDPVHTVTPTTVTTTVTPADPDSQGTAIPVDMGSTEPAQHEIHCSYGDDSAVKIEIKGDIKTGRVRNLDGQPVYVGYGADYGASYGWPTPASDPVADVRTKLCDADASSNGNLWSCPQFRLSHDVQGINFYVSVDGKADFLKLSEWTVTGVCAKTNGGDKICTCYTASCHCDF